MLLYQPAAMLLLHKLAEHDIHRQMPDPADLVLSCLCLYSVQPAQAAAALQFADEIKDAQADLTLPACGAFSNTEPLSTAC